MTRFFAACLVSAALAVPFAFGVPATAATQAQDGKTKINLAGRQRMLSQRMAKAACFAAMNIEPAKHMDMLSEAHALFGETHKAFFDGNERLGVAAERNPWIRTDLTKVSNLWADYDDAVHDALASKSVGVTELSAIAYTNMAVLLQMHDAVGTFERVYASQGEMHPALAVAINVSGRQRMLSQKAAKEFCFLVRGLNPERNRAALRATVAEFSAALDALIGGQIDRGLAPAPTQEVTAQLENVRALWEPVAAVYDKILNGRRASYSDVLAITRANDEILAEADKVVSLYSGL